MRTPGPQSYTSKVSAVPVVAVAVAVSSGAPGPQCVALNPSRCGLILSNQSAVVTSVYLMPKELFVAASSVPSFKIAAGGYWEDLKDYVGDVIIQGASADAGFLVATELL